MTLLSVIKTVISLSALKHLSSLLLLSFYSLSSVCSILVLLFLYIVCSHSLPVTGIVISSVTDNSLFYTLCQSLYVMLCYVILWFTTTFVNILTFLLYSKFFHHFRQLQISYVISLPQNLVSYIRLVIRSVLLASNVFILRLICYNLLVT